MKIQERGRKMIDNNILIDAKDVKKVYQLGENEVVAVKM